MDVTLNSLWCFKCFFQQQNQVAIQTYYFRVTTADLPLIDDNTLMNRVDAVLGVGFAPCITDTARYIGTTIQRVDTDPKPAQRVISNDIAGTGGSRPVPPQVAAIMYRGTALSGPKNRGRLYLPFIDQSAVDVTYSTPSAAYQTLVATWIATWYPVLNVPSISPTTILSPVLKQAGVSAGELPILTQVQLRTKFGTQKRRGEYGKANLSPF